MKILKRLLIVLLLAAVATGLILGYRARRNELNAEAEREAPIKPPLRVASKQGQSFVSLDAASLARGGIRTAPLQPLSHAEEVRVNGVVVAVQDLIDWRNNYLAAQYRLEKARTSIEYSRPAYERVKSLYDDDRNASLKAVQAAEGTLRADQAEARAAEAALPLLEGSLRQQWGAVVAGWALRGTPEFQRLMEQTERLVQVTIPASAEVAEPALVATLEAFGGRRVAVRLVSPAPRVLDARIQGLSYFFSAPAESGLVPGTNLVVLLPRGRPRPGLVVPDAAVVWWQGKAWCYVQAGAGRFARREVPTAAPVAGGWFAGQGFARGEMLVVGGAQVLLSEELRSQLQTEGEVGR